MRRGHTERLHDEAGSDEMSENDEKPDGRFRAAEDGGYAKEEEVGGDWKSD